VVQPKDQGTTITNAAVVTVRTTGVDAQAFQAADTAEVRVSAADIPVTGASGFTQQILIAMSAIAAGSIMLVIVRRRRSAG
jgi:hypothetical protein